MVSATTLQRSVIERAAISRRGLLVFFPMFFLLPLSLNSGCHVIKQSPFLQSSAIFCFYFGRYASTGSLEFGSRVFLTHVVRLCSG